jgi:uncharacterized membrane protein
MQKQVLPPTWLQFLILIVLILGIFFRFANLDRKVYWIDETYTSLRISGHTETEFIHHVFDGHVVNLKELQKYQQPNPEKGLVSTINSLAVESPQHPPLYYLMARFWVQWFGNSPAVIRSLSALISLLVFPCVYWLCWELFGSLTGWIAIALIAVSPFHILYAQEAREYSLWTVTIALSSAALLHAIRLKTIRSWVIYAATVTLGLYTFIFSLFVIIGHAVYVIIIEHFRLSKTVINYFLATLVGILAFSPWIFVVITNLSQVQTTAAWTELKLPFGRLLQGWIIHLGCVFFDLNSGYKYLRLPTLVLLVLVVYSIYFLLRKTPKQVWLFVLTLIGATALALVLPDLILGGMRSIQARYLMPCYLGIPLAVAYLLATQIACTSAKIRQQKIWQFVLIVMITGSIFSCAISSQAEFWWNKSPDKHRYNPQVASIINSAEQPLLISDNSTVISSSFACRILALSYLLNPKVQLQLVVEPNIPQIPDGFSDVFLFSPSEALRQGIEKEQAYRAKLVFQRDNFWLWKVVTVRPRQL